ncbi:MAG: UDP-N-acetylmuramoyl-L-alanine--D-glutamate ligase [Fusobacterium perfoetens]|uniref:UDP-N-acetylmuramoyl-L-alanine--D-glutamate ligase n=1 Tax=Fusobacterium perfoetens TaxID=852 RepID=UPI0023F58E92|nr:UDP-N-acetylmuramoyl-L-alanine--D-glutamate ligase [Fusobacterium perfoetens]MCI6153018.1 UDP-N-acetylmuramoyl-L-alanine--D-glutamate ligase [Fusobacterium perfoetens]MDY3237415.1 UDP-N-acetylmuramoyl-L-alanine--D-glutamate ligase [Fusobacterium perfoetens]
MEKAIVFGNGVSGKGAKKLLESKGVEVVLVDDNSGVKSSDAVKILAEINLFIKSPGIPFDNELVKKALDLGIEVIDEIELGYRYIVEKKLPTKIVAITGSNGKTTTTSKTTELLQKAGFKAMYAGNIGNSFAELLLENPDLDYAVLELSSFQLEGIKNFKPYISLIVNLSPDHLDRYAVVEDYYEAKFNICKNQKDNDIFIYNVNDDETMKRIPSKVFCDTRTITVGKNKEIANCFEENGWVLYNGEQILEVDKLSLKGKHNLENSLFIITIGKILNISNEVIQNCLYNTKSLEHRMELFYKWGNTIFINDSKGTNLDSTNFAIAAYKGSILICGGKDKGLPLDSMIENIKLNIKKVYLIGKMANRVEKSLLETNYSKENIFNLGTLENVLKHIKENITLEDKEVVLLSPSTSSYDQFKSFEHRGKVFKELVEEIFVGGEIL